MTALLFVWVILTLKNSGCDNYTETDIHMQMVRISHGCQWI